MAVIKTIFKGESLSMLFTFPVAYDMARIEKHEVYIGETAFTGTVSGKTVALKLKSEDTGAMSGQYKVSLWIDDATLGVRKPYIGDIVFSNTNATPHNTSTSEVTDIIVPIVISETAVTVGDILYNYVKGDKGDPFLYADFTPAQIAELQQPAADAIASIQAVELSVEQAEALRVQAEIDRQTNTGTAIQNAETATQNADTATDLALEVANHPNIIQNDYWYKWNTTTDVYENTNIKAKGEQGIQGGGKIITWSAGAYLSGDQVNHLGKDWVANAATLSTDVPGTSTKWVNRLSGMEGGAVALNDTKNVSGGTVYNANLKKADLVIGKNLFDKSNFTSGFIIGTTGVVSANGSSGHSDYIPVIAGQSYYNTGDRWNYCFYNSSYVPIPATGGITTWVVPVNVAFVRISFNLSMLNTVQLELGTVATSYEAYSKKVPLEQLNVSSKLNISDIINNLVSTETNKPLSANQGKVLNEKILTNTQNLTTKADLVAGKNLFDKSKATDGFYVTGNGNIIANALYFYSDYIPVVAGTTYVHNMDIYNYCFYNISKEVVSGTVQSASFTAPVGVAYVRISRQITSKDISQFEVGTVISAYEPYSPTVPVSQLPKSLFPALITQSFELYTPKTIYSCVDTSGLINSVSQKATTCYLEHFLQMPSGYNVNLKPFFKETDSNRYELPILVVDNPTDTANFNNGQNLVEANRTITTGGGLEEKTVTFKHRSLKTGVLATKTVNILCIGDSVTNGVSSAENNAFGKGVSYVDYIKILFEIDKQRFANNTGFNVKMIGTRENSQKVAGTLLTTVINGYTVSAKNYHEGSSSWNLYIHMMLPYFTVSAVRLWSVLGLKTVYGVEYASATQLQKDEIYKTYYGQFSPTKDDYYIRAMLYKSELTDTYTPVAGDLAIADAKYTDLLTNPDNKFYHKSTESATRGHCFSLSEYLLRYKTIDALTGDRLIVGSTAGTKVTDANAYDVCEPSVIWNQHGFNGYYPLLIPKFINYIKEYNTNNGTSIVLGWGVPDLPFQNFNKLYPEFRNNLSEWSERKTRYKDANNLLKSLEDEANNFFHVNIGVVAPTSYSQNHISIGDTSELSGVSGNKNLLVTSIGISFIHPNSIAHAAWGHQIYCWIKYLCSQLKL